MLDVHQAERLLVTGLHLLLACVEQKVFVEVPQMVMAVGLRPDENVRPTLRGTDVKVRITRVVTQEVEMKELVLPGCYATVLDGAIVRREGF